MSRTARPARAGERGPARARPGTGGCRPRLPHHPARPRGDRCAGRPTEARVEHGERAAEGTPGVDPVRLRPEQGRQRVAVDRPADHGEIGQQGDGLAGVDGERRAVDQNLDGAEEPDLDGGFGVMGHRRRNGSRNRTDAVTFRERHPARMRP